MNTVTKPRAIFGVAKRNVPGVIFRATAMYNGFTANAATFTSPTISMVSFEALITQLSAAQQTAKEIKGKVTSTARNTKRDALWTAMEVLQKYAQSMADILSGQAAASLITSAGLLVAEAPKRSKAVLTAVLTAAAGTVHLEANRTVLVGPANLGKQVTYNWSWSANGTTWNSGPSTPLASTNIAGLTPMTTYSFRVSITIGQETGAWCQPVSILVH
jgi:hypothetical protein